MYGQEIHFVKNKMEKKKQLSYDSVVSPRFVDKPQAVVKLLALWSDSMAAEQIAGQSNHLHATGVDGETTRTTCANPDITILVYQYI